MATLFVDKVDPQSGTSLEIGSSGDTVNLAGNVGTGFPTNEAEFSVIIAGSGSTNIATSTATIIPFGSEEFDPDGVFNTSTYKFTAPSAGKYFFSWCVRKADFTSNRFYIDIKKNSTGVGTFETGVGSSDYGSVGGTILLDLAQNDTVHGEVVHNQGGTQAITNNNTRFFGFKLI